MSESSHLLAETARSAEAIEEEFLPRRFLRNGHLQTLVANYLPRHYALPAAQTHIVQVDPGEMKFADIPASDAPGRFAQAQKDAHEHGASHVICHCHWQAEPEDCLTVLLVHGLEGSSSSHHVQGNAARAWAAGCNVIRMNMRNCGGGEDLSPTLYHSGLSGDVAAVMRTLGREKGLGGFALVGYSMGGNLVLKLAGELGTEVPDRLKAVVGVSPAMDLAASADALHNVANRVYEWKFLAGLRRRFRRKAALFPAIYSTDGLEKISTLRQFDDRITARYSGFLGAEEYYSRCSSSNWAAQIAVPAFVLHALDDPFVRMLPSTRAALLRNPGVRLVETAHGGHCAFLAAAVDDDGYWAEKMLLGFLLSVSRG